MLVDLYKVHPIHGLMEDGKADIDQEVSLYPDIIEVRMVYSGGPGILYMKSNEYNYRYIRVYPREATRIE